MEAAFKNKFEIFYDGKRYVCFNNILDNMLLSLAQGKSFTSYMLLSNSAVKLSKTAQCVPVSGILDMYPTMLQGKNTRPQNGLYYVSKGISVPAISPIDGGIIKTIGFCDITGSVMYNQSMICDSEELAGGILKEAGKPLTVIGTVFARVLETGGEHIYRKSDFFGEYMLGLKPLSTANMSFATSYQGSAAADIDRNTVDINTMSDALGVFNSATKTLTYEKNNIIRGMEFTEFLFMSDYNIIARKPVPKNHMVQRSYTLNGDLVKSGNGGVTIQSLRALSLDSVSQNDITLAKPYEYRTFSSKMTDYTEGPFDFICDKDTLISYDGNSDLLIFGRGREIDIYDGSTLKKADTTAAPLQQKNIKDMRLFDNELFLTYKTSNELSQFHADLNGITSKGMVCTHNEKISAFNFDLGAGRYVAFCKNDRQKTKIYNDSCTLSDGGYRINPRVASEDDIRLTGFGTQATYLYVTKGNRLVVQWKALGNMLDIPTEVQREIAASASSIGANEGFIVVLTKTNDVCYYDAADFRKIVLPGGGCGKVFFSRGYDYILRSFINKTVEINFFDDLFEEFCCVELPEGFRHNVLRAVFLKNSVLIITDEKETKNFMLFFKNDLLRYKYSDDINTDLPVTIVTTNNCFYLRPGINNTARFSLTLSGSYE
jgi:hypothetical protein